MAHATFPFFMSEPRCGHSNSARCETVPATRKPIFCKALDQKAIAPMPDKPFWKLGNAVFRRAASFALFPQRGRFQFCDFLQLIPAFDHCLMPFTAFACSVLFSLEFRNVNANAIRPVNTTLRCVWSKLVVLDCHSVGLANCLARPNNWSGSWC